MRKVLCRRHARGCARPFHGHEPAFSLVELLVVMGIIALLMGLLFPALSKARRQADLTACLARLREIGLALSDYTQRQDGVLPYGAISNSIDSPYSPRGLAYWKNAPVYFPGKPITIHDQPIPPDHLHPDWAGACTAPVAELCMRLHDDLRMWECPSQQMTNEDGAFHSSQMVLKPDQPANIQQAFEGHDPQDEWRPGYLYMATWENFYFLHAHQDIAAHYHMQEFYDRNVAGLPIGRVRPIDGAGPDHVVVATDYSVRYHAPAAPDVYDLPVGQKARYTANFAFLDGHAETRRFSDFDSYLAQFHAPINSGHQAGGY